MKSKRFFRCYPGKKHTRMCQEFWDLGDFVVAMYGVQNHRNYYAQGPSSTTEGRNSRD